MLKAVADDCYTCRCTAEPTGRKKSQPHLSVRSLSHIAHLKHRSPVQTRLSGLLEFSTVTSSIDLISSCRPECRASRCFALPGSWVSIAFPGGPSVVSGRPLPVVRLSREAEPLAEVRYLVSRSPHPRRSVSADLPARSFSSGSPVVVRRGLGAATEKGKRQLPTTLALLGRR